MTEKQESQLAFPPSGGVNPWFSHCLGDRPTLCLIAAYSVSTSHA